MEHPIPKELRAQIPKLYRTRGETDPIVWVKFFSPVTTWRWYIIECEGVASKAVFYGWLVSAAEKHGRFIRTDLVSMRAYFSITIERDPDFVPCRLAEVVAREQGLQRFALGQLAITPGALAAFQATGESPATYLRRHAQGDWGALDEDDVAENEYAVTRPLRLLSAYALADGIRIWILTEADRSATTILLPEEY